MALGLKAPPRMFSKKMKEKMKRKPFSKTGDFITGGVTALLGTALLSTTADAVNRI